MKIKLNVDSKDYTEKPKADAGKIRLRLCSADSIREITPDNLINAIQRGRSFTPAVMTGTDGSTWQSQQVIVADIDNDENLLDDAGKPVKGEDGKYIKVCIPDPLTPDEALAAMREYGIDPYFMYYSFSNTADWPRYRVVIILDEPLTNLDDAKTFTSRLANLFDSTREARAKDGKACADSGMADAARLLFGGRADCVFYRSDKATSAATLLHLPPVTATAAAAPAQDVKPMAERPQQPNLNRAMQALESKLHDDINTFDLAAYVMATTSSREKRIKGGASSFFNPCPICGHNDCMQVTGAMWHCFSSNHSGKTGGTIIDYLMRYHGIELKDAMEKFKFDIMHYDRDEWTQAFFDSLKTTPTDDFTDLDAPTEATAAPLAGDGAPFSGTQPPATQAATGPAEAGTQPRPNYTEYLRKCVTNLAESEAAQDYLTGRGISLGTAAKCCIGFDPAWRSPTSIRRGKRPPASPRIIIPSTTTHYVACDIRPDLDDQQREFAKMNEGKPEIMGSPVLYSGAENVFVTEGAFDALSIIEAGQAAIALNSTSNADKLIKQLEAKPTTATLILCLGKDDAGKKTTEKLREGLTRLNISFVHADICGGHKDPNEALQADRATFEKAIEKAVADTAAKPDSTKAYLASYMGDDMKRRKELGQKRTGLPNLDDATRGGLRPGLFLIGAATSLGKTTFCTQLADGLAENGSDVIYFSLEQSKLELMAKSLSRGTARIDISKAVTGTAIMDGYTPPIVMDAMRNHVEKTGDRLSIVECGFDMDVGKVCDYVRRYVKNNNVRPVVFIDYLQVLNPRPQADGKYSKREAVEQTLTDLVLLKKELDLTIIAIVSLNRSSYLYEFDFESIKETGLAEFSADAVWGLQLQCFDEPLFEEEKKLKEKRARVKEAYKEIPRKLKLVSRKHRGQQAIYNCCFDYYPQYDLFVPTAQPVAPNSNSKSNGKKRI